VGADAVEDRVNVTAATTARSPRRRRRRGLVIGGVLLVAAGTGGGLAAAGAFDRGPATPPSPDSGAPTSTALVTRQALSAQTSVNGTLGYSGSYDVINQASGTITGLPGVGGIIRQGHALYHVLGSPVIFLYGAKVPAYRTLSVTMTGQDVQQLNADLVALGYASRADLDPHSDYFSWVTQLAVEKLQEAMGLTQTGELDLGQVVFLDAKTIRITKVMGIVGASAPGGAPILQASSTDRYVTIALDTSMQSDVHVGDHVMVTLPTNRAIPGRITSIASVAVATAQGSTIGVNVRLSDPRATGTLDQAPVTVEIVDRSVPNAIAVPVNALVSQPGGYAVEVVGANGVRRLIRVTTGLFDDNAGLVQVTGAGLAVGERIVVPAS
jgi:peptidoglycan hydrolase-like protein with peptidoglycan-binding domain